MKFSKTMFGLVFCCICNYTYADYIRTTYNGGKNGYQVTQKTVIDGNTEINCVDPGYEACPTISYNSNEQPAIDYAITQITQGFLSGTETINGVTVNWQSLDRQMINSRIIVR